MPMIFDENNLVAVAPKVGQEVFIAGYDLDAPDYYKEFVDNNIGKIFTINQVGNWTSGLVGTDFRPKHRDIYIAGQINE